MALRIQRLTGAEELTGKARIEQIARRARGAVQHQHRHAAGVADGGIGQLHRRQGLAIVEAEIPRDPAGLTRGGVFCGRRHAGQGQG